MAEAKTGEVAVLVLRDSAGNFYVLDEGTIRASRATPEQQAAVEKAIGDVDVRGYVAGPGGLVALGSITVAPQINVNVGTNVAAGNFAPVTQLLGQTGLNAFGGAPNP